MMVMSETRGVRPLSVVLSIALGIVMVFSIGAMSGAGIAILDGTGKTGKSALVLIGALLLAVGSLWGLIRLKPWGDLKAPVSPRVRKANNLLLLSGGLGGLLGAALALGTLKLDSPFALFTNTPIPAVVVIPVLLIWLVLVPLVSWQWHRYVDEHEAEAYQFAGLAGLYLYAFLAPAWWLAWRGGLVPAPDTMAIYASVMIVWGVVWFWRRHR